MAGHCCPAMPFCRHRARPRIGPGTLIRRMMPPKIERMDASPLERSRRKGGGPKGPTRRMRMTVATTKLSAILLGLSVMLKYKARRHTAFRARLKERNLVAQIVARDEECGRWFEIKDGEINSGRGLHASP